MRKKMSFTAVFQKVPEGYIGFVEELPGANTQGVTLEEARQNLKEAVRLVLEANRKLVSKTSVGTSKFPKCRRFLPGLC
jgi:predicted RNase H-like HicB family nuclease